MFPRLQVPARGTRRYKFRSVPAFRNLTTVISVYCSAISWNIFLSTRFIGCLMSTLPLRANKRLSLIVSWGKLTYFFLYSSANAAFSLFSFCNSAIFFLASHSSFSVQLLKLSTSSCFVIFITFISAVNLVFSSFKDSTFSMYPARRSFRPWSSSFACPGDMLVGEPAPSRWEVSGVRWDILESKLNSQATTLGGTGRKQLKFRPPQSLKPYQVWAVLLWRVTCSAWRAWGRVRCKTLTKQTNDWLNLRLVNALLLC